MPATSNTLSLSLFELMRTHFDGVLPIVRCSKATLVHLSHTLEDMVLSRRLPSMLFTGFQESSHWREETERYRALASIAQQVCIFAGGQLPPESDANQLHITLRGDDPLRQEWFLIILSSSFCVLLCGQDRLEPTAEESQRQFDTLWSFDPKAVGRVLDLLEQVVEAYRPERLAQLREARNLFGLPAPDPTIISLFTLEMIRFEEGLHRALYQTNLALDEQLQWRNSMTQTMVHDLRTPLQGLLISLEMLGQGESFGKETFNDTLRLARRTAYSLQNLVQTILETSQLEVGQLKLQWQPIDPRLLFGQVAESFRYLMDAVSLNLDLIVSPEIKILWADQQLLDRVLQNLISNAIKFTSPKGTVSVELRPGIDSEYYELRVRDSGQGIPSAMLPYIFERHFQVNRGDRRGLGIGLYFCRLVVEAHGGSIRADSQIGIGTTITMLFRARPKFEGFV